MEATSVVPAIAVFLVASATAAVLSRRFGTRAEPGRFASIDGLRGYLAVSVLACHACIWFFHARTGEWTLPPSNLYTHFGQSGVALFFMISGFLFFSKLLDERTRGMDWTRLFVSRFLRLTPLYLCTIAGLVLIVFVLARARQVPLQELMQGVARWAFFTIMGAPDLNGVANTWRIVAGVTWSLPYEWLFYLSLPTLALLIGSAPRWPFLLLSIGSLVAFAFLDVVPIILATFLGGIAAALFVRIEVFRQFARSALSTLLCLTCFALAVALHPSAYAPGSIVLISIGFILIACGNTLFGVLTTRASRLLGDVAYGVYLLHGMALFLLFGALSAVPPTISAVTHWTLVVLLVPVLLLVCLFAYRNIELPAMRRTNRVSGWLAGTRKGAEPTSAPTPD